MFEVCELCDVVVEFEFCQACGEDVCSTCHNAYGCPEEE